MIRSLKPFGLNRTLLFVAEQPGVQRIERLLKPGELNVVATSGGKFLLTNHPLARAGL